MNPTLRLVAPLVLVVGLGTLLTPASADPERPAPARSTAADGTPLLKKSLGGKQAVRALGSDLDVAARRNNLTPTQLRTILTEDPSAFVHPTGRLAYVEERPEPSAARSEAAALDLIAPEAQTFALHSLPGSKHTIYLDFDGADVSGTAWNFDAQSNEEGIPDGTYDAFSLDANFGAFSTAEHEWIQEIWRVVAENYATFDVDVTTEEPSPGAYNRSSPSDASYGDHVLFTDDPASFPICNPAPPDRCGGVAFVDTFDELYESGDDENFYEPAWVRTLGNATETALAASHEIGHTLGLRHDGRVSPDEAYYEGQGAWTPIMGSGGNAIHQFSKGEYPRASNTQDDLAVIQARGGLPALPDDAGGTLATATTLGARTEHVVRGVIGNRADQDIFKIGTCTGAITVSAEGTGTGSALDLRVDIFDGAGTLLGSADPPSGQTGSNPRRPTGLDVPALTRGPAGTYYVKVDGVGAGNPATTGYTDYGSIGSYTLRITGCVAVNGTPPGAPTVLSMPSKRGVGTVTWKAPTTSGSSPITGYRISGLPGGPVEVAGAGTTSAPVTLRGGRDLHLRIVALNASGAGAPGTLETRIASWAPSTPPTVTVSTRVLTATLAWAPGANPGGAVLYGWRLQEGSRPPTTLPWPDFESGVKIVYSSYGTRTIKVTPLMYAGDGSTAPSRTVSIVIATTPSAPRIGRATSGAPGGPVSATARWAAAYDGGAAIRSYRVTAYRVNARGQVLAKRTSPALRPQARAYAFKLARGSYRFRVVATTVKGASPASAASRTVTAR